MLQASRVLMHPFVVGELACSSLHDRGSILALLQHLPVAAVAEHDEVLHYIERHALHGLGVGDVDAHLLISVALSGHARLWTRDKRLRAISQTLGCTHQDTVS
jgi:predicted nucleic acid-binding protein